jgi:flagellar motor switch protein FliG
VSEQLSNNGAQIVASLLGALPSDLAGKVLNRISPAFAEPIRKQLGKTPTDSESLKRALRELSDVQRMMARPAPAKSTTVQAAAAPATQFPTPEEIAADPTRALRSLNAAQLFTALGGEEAHLIAGVMACLDPSVAADLLTRLPPTVRPDLTLRLSQNISLRRDIIECLANAMVERMRKHKDAPPEPETPDRVGRTATVLRALTRTERLEVFKKLEATDPETAVLVGQQLYQFADLLRVENRSMQMMLSELDIKVLARALMSAPSNIISKVQANLSSRAKEALIDEQSLFDKLPQEEIDNARTTVLSTLRSMDFEGRLNFDS